MYDYDFALRLPVTAFRKLVAATLGKISASVLRNHRTNFNSILLKLLGVCNDVFNNQVCFCHLSISLLKYHRSSRHHVDGGSLAEIFVARSATRWLRLYGRPWRREHSLQRMYRSSSWMGVVFGRRTMSSGDGLVRVTAQGADFEIAVPALRASPSAGDGCAGS